MTIYYAWYNNTNSTNNSSAAAAGAPPDDVEHWPPQQALDHRAHPRPEQAPVTYIMFIILHNSILIV